MHRDSASSEDETQSTNDSK